MIRTAYNTNTTLSNKKRMAIYNRLSDLLSIRNSKREEFIRELVPLLKKYSDKHSSKAL